MSGVLVPGSRGDRYARGFTLAELLVVIVVIGILAAIAVPVLLSQADKASDASLKSDLANAAKLLQVAEANGETLPSTIAEGQVVDLGSAGTFTSSQTLTVTGSGETLCVEGVSDSGDTYSADLSEGVRNYDCDGHPNGDESLLLSYADTTFTAGLGAEVLSATVTGGEGDKTYSVAETLPDGVTFDETTGAFTGPASSSWDFTATQVDAGHHAHSCAVTDQGGVKCWGHNGSGQLGNGTTIDQYAPVDVVGLTSGVRSVTVGYSHTCAITTSGALKCWGSGSWNKLGIGGKWTQTTPFSVPGFDSGVESVALGFNHTCVVTTSGNVRCWGYNQYGMLGDGTTTHSGTPVDVVDGAGNPLADVASVTASEYHTCALTDIGGVKCWGRNNAGRLGDGTMEDSSTAVDVVGLDSGVTHLDTGRNHTCAVTSNGAAKCWGYNWNGWLGDGTTTHRSEPVGVIGLESGVESVDVGRVHTCAVTISGAAKCWGHNPNGQLGDGTTTRRIPAVLFDVFGLSSGVSTVTSGVTHTCALLDSGRVNCWGSNSSGRLGDGTGVDSLTAVEVKQTPPGLPVDVTVTVSDDSGTDTVNVSLTVG